ncbi:unnamed protein product [Paramecium sonneborni]|uniref:Uncharacterized protein n=1 Tax=Paramecium sonneborni TaxID=65129 RepID=A0A8S1Q3B4_9CILI|nr:unnamed protein product [Paramecium sonneborni]
MKNHSLNQNLTEVLMLKLRSLMSEEKSLMQMNSQYLIINMNQAAIHIVSNEKEQISSVTLEACQIAIHKYNMIKKIEKDSFHHKCSVQPRINKILSFVGADRLKHSIQSYLRQTKFLCQSQNSQHSLQLEMQRCQTNQAMEGFFLLQEQKILLQDILKNFDEQYSKNKVQCSKSLVQNNKYILFQNFQSQLSNHW